MEERDTFRTKKINKLNIKEAMRLKGFLETQNQKESKKYLELIKHISNLS